MEQAESSRAPLTVSDRVDDQHSERNGGSDEDGEDRTRTCWDREGSTVDHRTRPRRSGHQDDKRGNEGHRMDQERGGQQQRKQNHRRGRLCLLRNQKPSVRKNMPTAMQKPNNPDAGRIRG